VGNPAEETYCHPNTISVLYANRRCQLVNGRRRRSGRGHSCRNAHYEGREQIGYYADVRQILLRTGRSNDTRICRTQPGCETRPHPGPGATTQGRYGVGRPFGTHVAFVQEPNPESFRGWAIIKHPSGMRMKFQ
jgi:hypothetical protein